MKHYTFVETCGACPHQFDVYDGDNKVAYVRLRYGYLAVYPYKKEKYEHTSQWTGKTTIEQDIDFDTLIWDTEEFDDGIGLCGIIPSDKYEETLDKIDEEIFNYYNTNCKE